MPLLILDRRRSFWLAITVCGVGIALVMSAFPERLLGLQEPNRLVVAVDDPRPLAAAVTFLERRFGWTITYEDPRFEHTDDIEDVTAKVRRDGDLSKKVLVPRGGALSLTYESSERLSAVDVLNRLLESYSQAGYPGRFAVVEAAGMLHVVPVQTRDRNGAESRQDSILASVVSLDERDRTDVEMIQEVLRQVEIRSKQTVRIGSIPQALMHRRSRAAANKEMARSVLVRALARDEQRFSWQLLYGPDTRMYFLNVTAATGLP